MKTSTVIAQTSKGHRIWLEGIGHTGQRYNVTYLPEYIVITFPLDGSGKRKVVPSKGGVIDLEGKKVSTWRQVSTHVDIAYESNVITISRG